jgi:signal transduction histidine kinase
MMQSTQRCTTFLDQVSSHVKRSPSLQDRKNSLVSNALPLAEGIGLAHDAGNLLGALGLYADLLSMPGLSPDEPLLYAQEIRHIAERTLSLIKKLANYPESPKRDCAPTMLHEIIATYKDLLSRLVGRTITVSGCTSFCPPVSISREAIERVLLNVVKNAAAATPKSGTIYLTVSRSCENGATYTVLTVSDDGIGMSETMVKRLQHGRLLPRSGGKGVGFQVIRELVVESGGTIEISSCLGKGTSVRVKWPDNPNRKYALPINRQLDVK